MKAKFVAIVALTTLTLSACGDKHEKVYAVDKLAQAQAVALEKAPKAEEVKFDDHTKPSVATDETANNVAAQSEQSAETDTAPEASIEQEAAKTDEADTKTE